MRIAVASIEGVSPYSQSKHYTDPAKGEKETSSDYERRTWMHRCHVNSDGYVFMPPMGFKNCIAEAAKFLGVQVPGKGKATYTKHFEAGVLVTEPLVLPVKFEEVKGEWLFVPADGRRGSGKRVEKCFPVFHQWSGEVPFLIFDDTITKETFEYHLQQAGSFIGVGRFRPRNNGFYGRFKVNGIRWEQ